MATVSMSIVFQNPLLLPYHSKTRPLPRSKSNWFQAPTRTRTKPSSSFSSIRAQSGIASLNRSSFPAGFIFGVGSSSYQFEGAANEGGRGPSIWDTYTHKYPERINDSSNGDIAVDQYHRYKEDVRIMKNMGWDAYRFSISWSRLLPNGKLSGGVNKEGIQHYNNLINELLRNEALQKLLPVIAICKSNKHIFKKPIRCINYKTEEGKISVGVKHNKDLQNNHSTRNLSRAFLSTFLCFQGRAACRRLPIMLNMLWLGCSFSLWQVFKCYEYWPCFGWFGLSSHESKRDDVSCGFNK